MRFITMIPRYPGNLISTHSLPLTTHLSIGRLCLPDREKTLVRLVCLVIDEFHFDLSLAVEVTDDAPLAAPVPKALTAATGTGATTETPTAIETAAEAPEGDEEEEAAVCLDDQAIDTIADATKRAYLIRNAITNRLLPKLFALSKQEGETEVVRSKVVLGIVKLLKLLPERYVLDRVPALLQLLCNALKSRAQSVR